MSFLDFLSSAFLILVGSVTVQFVFGFCLAPLTYLIVLLRTPDPRGYVSLVGLGLANAARSYLSASLIGLAAISHSSTILGRVVLGAIGVLILLATASSIMQSKVSAGFYEEDPRRGRDEAI